MRSKDDNDDGNNDDNNNDDINDYDDNEDESMLRDNRGSKLLKHTELKKQMASADSKTPDE